MGLLFLDPALLLFVYFAGLKTVFFTINIRSGQSASTRPGRVIAPRMVEILLSLGGNLSTGNSHVSMRKKPSERNSLSIDLLSQSFRIGRPEGQNSRAFVVSRNR